MGIETEYRVYVMYDITDNRRRYRMVKLLEGYGRRIQKSVFEFTLTKKKYHEMIRQIPAQIDEEEDVVHAVLTNRNTICRQWGVADLIEDEDYLIL